MNRSLTISSVSFHSAFYLTLNKQLTAALNPDNTWKWLVVENTPMGSGETITDESGFVVLKGDPKTYVGPASGSYHHGVAINKTLGHIKTRFALFLDPDFYIVRPGWIDDVLNHMQTNGLAFFGAPWHPKWVQKYRYFPCVQCMFVDLEKADIQGFDFSPDCPHLLTEPAYLSAATKQNSGSFKWVNSASDQILRHLGLENFKAIGATKDTGYRIYERYHLQKQMPSECVAPVFKRETDHIGVTPASARIGRLFGRILPDRLSFLPTKLGYSTRVGFSDLGYPDAAGEGWEEFMWKGKPFGFHLRGHARVARELKEKDSLDEIIEVFSGQQGSQNTSDLTRKRPLISGGTLAPNSESGA